MGLWGHHLLRLSHLSTGYVITLRTVRTTVIAHSTRVALAPNKVKTQSQSSVTWDTISFILGVRPAKPFVFGYVHKTDPNTKAYMAECTHGRQLTLQTSHPATRNIFHTNIARDVFPKQLPWPNQCFPPTNNTLIPRYTSSQLTRRAD